MLRGHSIELASRVFQPKRNYEQGPEVSVYACNLVTLGIKGDLLVMGPSRRPRTSMRLPRSDRFKAYSHHN